MVVTMLQVKIGTAPQGQYKQVKRAPSYAWFKVVRGAPKKGDTFAVIEDGKLALLQCYDVKPELGPLYYATRV